MALGGGVWFSQNKKLPGAYINFVARMKATASLLDRGIVAMGMALDWGVDGEIMELTSGDFIKDSLKLFGYEYTDEKLKGLRDLFKYARIAYIYKLNSNTAGGKATNTYATAKCAGTRGNSLKIRISANADDNTKFNVETLLGNTVVDMQIVASSAGLVANDYVTWKSAELAVTAASALTGGTDATVTAANHQTFLGKIEAYSVNAVGVVNDEANGGISNLNSLYAAWCKRMRDELGIKLQVVVYNYAADYEGVVNVKNPVTDSGVSAASLVYWVTGLVAGTATNASALNLIYNGEYTVSANYTQTQLEAAITAGQFTLHKVENDLRVLADINSLTTTTLEKSDDFKKNQTIRVIDEIALSIAHIFNTKYLGRIPNDADGRIALWADIVAHHRELERVRAIENFDEDEVIVEQGIEKGNVLVNDAISVVNAMEKLYMTCVVA